MTKTKTKTEELREEIAELEYVLHSKYYGRKYGYHKWDDLPPVMRDEIYSTATQILRICQEAGLAFVVEDAELPKLEAGMFPQIGASTGDGWDKAQRYMLKAGYRQTEEIELP